MNTPPTTFGSWEAAVTWLRSQPDQRDLVRAAYYDDPLLLAAERYWHSEEWAAVRHWLPLRRGCALDVGAGRGIASYALARDGFDVTALEPDRGDVVGSGAIRSLARESDLSIDIVEAYSESLPFADRHFDLVFARAVLHHTRDLRSACAEYFRVLKPGGCILALREHVISRPEDLTAFFEVHPLHRYYGGENAYILDRYLQALVDSGFVLSRILAPLESPINFAPHTLASLQREIADRLAQRLPGVRDLAERLLGLPLVWRVARTALQRMDDRPGRLYSFLARRPDR